MKLEFEQLWQFVFEQEHVHSESIQWIMYIYNATTMTKIYGTYSETFWMIVLGCSNQVRHHSLSAVYMSAVYMSVFYMPASHNTSGNTHCD